MTPGCECKLIKEQKMKLTKTLLSILLLSFLSFTCKKSPTGPGDNIKVNLSTVDVSCTEAWLKVKAEDVSFPLNLTIKTDDKIVINYSVSSSDSVIYIDSLLPNKTYTLQGSYTDGGSSQPTNKISFTTMDTTSNNFTWQTYTFGDPSAGSSGLNDVAIIDENNIYSVGEIYKNDSTGKPDPQPYNIVHWDGNNWTPLKAPYDYQGRLYYHPIQSVLTFNANDILFCGNGILHWNGTIYEPFPIRTSVWGEYQINKIWGINNDNFYIVGNVGNIAHYQNGNWQKIQSGTTTNLNDIWGIDDSAANSSLILSTVSSRYQRGDYKLLSISDDNAGEFINWPYTRLYGVWFLSRRKIYVVGDGAYLYVNDSLSSVNLPSNYFLTRVKGSGLSDVYIAGCCNTLFHFNGIRWHKINGIYGNYEGLDVKGNLVVAVGWTGSQGIIIMGRRQ